MIRAAACAAALVAGLAQAQGWHGPDAPTTQPPAPPAAVAGGGDHVRLGHAIAVKLAEPEFAAARNVRGKLPPSSFGMPEEQAVRQARDRVASARRAPPDAQVRVIPRAASAPTLDGVVNEAEWRGALRVALQPEGRKAFVLMLTHGGQLYLAALAPGDRSDDGFDQFRFWYHVDLSPFFENERTHVSGRGAASSRTLRGVRLPRGGEPVRDGMDAKTLMRDVDWGVHGKLRAASTLTGFRQYEVSLDLAEAGLGAAPFAAYLEIEGDPVMESGKFKARFNEGELGSQKEPIWFRLAR